MYAEDNGEDNGLLQCLFDAISMRYGIADDDSPCNGLFHTLQIWTPNRPSSMFD